MSAIALALGITYLALAYIHHRELGPWGRSWWTRSHCVMLSAMGVLYILIWSAGVVGQ